MYAQGIELRLAGNQVKFIQTGCTVQDLLNTMEDHQLILLVCNQIDLQCKTLKSEGKPAFSTVRYTNNLHQDLQILSK